MTSGLLNLRLCCCQLRALLEAFWARMAREAFLSGIGDKHSLGADRWAWQPLGPGIDLTPFSPRPQRLRAHTCCSVRATHSLINEAPASPHPTAPDSTCCSVGTLTCLPPKRRTQAAQAVWLVPDTSGYPEAPVSFCLSPTEPNMGLRG